VPRETNHGSAVQNFSYAMKTVKFSCSNYQLKLSTHNPSQTQPLTGLSPKKGHSLGKRTSCAATLGSSAQRAVKKRILYMKKNAIFLCSKNFKLLG